MTTSPDPSKQWSLLELINELDNVPHDGCSADLKASDSAYDKEIRLIPFHATLQDFRAGLPPVGRVPSDVLSKLTHQEGLELAYETEQEASASPSKSAMTSGPREDGDDGCSGGTVDHQPSQQGAALETGVQSSETPVVCIFFSDKVNARGHKARSEVMATLSKHWKDQGTFPNQTKNWNDELMPIFASPRSSAWAMGPEDERKQGEPFGNTLFEQQRCLMTAFGFAAFGTSLIVYEGEKDSMMIWVSKRSATSQAWPSKLDTTVAGGLSVGYKPIDNIVKEAEEEANLPEELIRNGARCTGIISRYTKAGNSTFAGTEYAYDLQLPSRDSKRYVSPTPDNLEAQSMQIMNLDETLAALRGHEFKPLAAMMTIDFLIRHGYITPESEADYFGIAKRLRRETGLAGPGADPRG
ncbi:hypothetical protein IAU60_000377 [Kwoniella sp. DSM 27419]